MRSPIAAGRVSSEYGQRDGGFHAGIDLRVDGDYGSPAFAAFSGSVERVVTTRVHDRDSSQPKNAGKPTIAPGRTGNGVIVLNDDGERQLYGHVAPSVGIGDVVAEGDRIGSVDDSGNTSGPHIHYEEWTASRATRNPRVSFRAFGITFPLRRAMAVGTPLPSAAVRKKLMAMDLPPTEKGVRKYQRAHGLFVDGRWAEVTERYYQWVRDLQIYLNTWDEVAPRVVVDGDRGKKTKAAEKQAKRAATQERPYRPPREPKKTA